MPNDPVLQAMTVTEPCLPQHLLGEVARLLDREANRALNAGRTLFAERCSRRAEELREGTQR